MPRKKTSGLTDAELRLMEVLWRNGPSTVTDVSAALPADVPLAYSSVLTTLRILETKGYLRHRKDGRAFIYEPVVARDEVRENAVTHLLRRFFENSPEQLMLNLIDGRKIGAKQLQRLRKRIEEAGK
jgi:predicted transcriptional regulator